MELQAIRDLHAQTVLKKKDSREEKDKLIKEAQDLRKKNKKETMQK